MNYRFFYFLLIACFLLSCSKKGNPSSDTETDKKVEQLLAAMTLEEKIGQMAQMNITGIMSDSIFKAYDSVTVFQLDTHKLIEYVKRYHVGSFLNGRGVSKETWFSYMDQLQRINMKYSRLKIPLLYGVDHVHGSSYLKEGTVFPHNINLAATFDTSFAYEMGKITVYETSGLGHNWIFAPVMDLGKNKLWGRYYETFGEDPVLAARMGRAFIKGIQESPEIAPYKVAACAKHFLGYSDPKSGWDRSPAEIPDQILREFFLPPFKEAIDAGVKTIMVNSGEINGVPVHASYEILTGLLREELGFKGVVVTDWLDIIALEKMHYVSENEKEATLKAIEAGIDISMIPLTTDFTRYVKELVEEKRLTKARIDASVRRILRLKFDLGLFDNPFPDKERLNRIGNKESKQKALDAARESIVLLKNKSSLLPLKAPQKIVVTGATANAKVPLCGGWTYRFAPASDWWFPNGMPTILDAVKENFPGSEVVFANEKELKEKTKNADVIIFALGEKKAYAETDGSINTLALSDDQVKWAENVFATGKPVVMVLTEGRPRIIGDLFDRANAVLFAGLPGVEGATAIAEILSGKVNPSGKMSFTYPFREGHMISYNHKKSEYSQLRPVKGELLRFALAEFGEGLSYTTFTYQNLNLSDTVVSSEGKITAKVEVRNSGNLEGKEAVLWFISDEFGSITRPVKELQHFEKKTIKPGETQLFTFVIDPDKHLSYPDKTGKKILEPGYFTVKAGNLEKRFLLK